MHGVIVIDKPAGKTSFDMVDKVRRALGVRKAGHTGTLDPLATGVLPVCLNEATKLVPFLMEGWKVYRATLLLGVRTDTLDREGRVERTCTPSVREAEVVAALKGCIGRRPQQAPRYSALKFKGKALYRWARQGIEVDPPSRIVEIGEVNVESFDMPYVTFTVRCSKGTYVRSLCAEVGENLGCGACLYALRRLRSGPFDEAMAVRMEDDGRGTDPERLRQALIPLIDALPGLTEVTVDETLARKIRAGHQPKRGDWESHDIPSLAPEDMIKFTLNRGALVAIGKVIRAPEAPDGTSGDAPFTKILRVFNP